VRAAARYPASDATYRHRRRPSTSRVVSPGPGISRVSAPAAILPGPRVPDLDPLPAVEHLAAEHAQAPIDGVEAHEGSPRTTRPVTAARENASRRRGLLDTNDLDVATGNGGGRVSPEATPVVGHLTEAHGTSAGRTSSAQTIRRNADTQHAHAATRPSPRIPRRGDPSIPTSALFRARQRHRACRRAAFTSRPSVAPCDVMRSHARPSPPCRPGRTPRAPRRHRSAPAHARPRGVRRRQWIRSGTRGAGKDGCRRPRLGRSQDPGETTREVEGRRR